MPVQSRAESPRVRSELLKLGVALSQSRISKYQDIRKFKAGMTSRRLRRNEDKRLRESVGGDRAPTYRETEHFPADTPGIGCRRASWFTYEAG